MWRYLDHLGTKKYEKHIFSTLHDNVPCYYYFFWNILVYNFFLKFVLKNACYRKWKILSIIQIERYGSFFQPQVSTSEEKLFNWYFSSNHRSLLQRNIYKNWWVFVNQTSILHRNIYKWIVFVCVRSSKNIIQLLAFNCIFSSPKPETSTVPVPFSLELLFMPHWTKITLSPKYLILNQCCGSASELDL